MSDAPDDNLPQASEAHARSQDDALDADLLIASARGDRDAYARLYERYSSRVYGMIVTVLGRSADADDVFQDVMLELWKRAASYDAALGKPSSWIMMIARSRAVDMMRRRKRQSDRLAAARRELGTEANAQSGSVTEDRPDNTENPQIAHVLKSLPKEQATVIRLAFAHGLTREEIAAATGSPVGTVKTRIRAGVRAMHEALSTHPHGQQGKEATT
jgi:RNA polymerase sigma-70 factor (ECF subfamily)